MATATVTFKRLIHQSQASGKFNKTIDVAVFFDLQVGGRKFSNVRVDVKQNIGKSFDDSPLEVSRPVGYDGPMNHEALSQEVKTYYRLFFDSRGRVIRRPEGAMGAPMENNEVHTYITVTFEIPPELAG